MYTLMEIVINALKRKQDPRIVNLGGIYLLCIGNWGGGGVL